jgi:hypothetical protein
MAAPKDGNTVPVNPDFADYYKKNEKEILALQDGAKLKTRDESARLAEFRTLRGKYPDPALATAAELVDDKSEKIAAFAVTVLGAAAVMSDHQTPDAAHQTPIQTYAMQRHEVARAALRKAQADPRKNVRDRATQTLASLSDEIGLRNIVVGAKEGRYSEIETVNHLGLAKPEVGLKLLQPYLATDKTPDVQAAAITYLANSPKYRQQIRDDFLLNPKAPMEARLVAAGRLAQDPRVALLVLGNAQTPPELFQETFLTYVRSAGPRHSPSQIESFQSILDTYKKLNPAAGNLSQIDQQLKAMKQANTP